MLVKIQSVVGGKYTSRTDGKKLLVHLRSLWTKADRIVLDFENMEIASVSFIDEAFGSLLDFYSLEEMVEKLKFENMDAQDKRLLNALILSRKREKEKLLRA